MCVSLFVLGFYGVFHHLRTDWIFDDRDVLNPSCGGLKGGGDDGGVGERQRVPVQPHRRI